MKMLRILTLTILAIYNSLWANNSFSMNTDRFVVARGNMISVRKLDIENNRMLLKSEEVNTVSFFALVFDGIIEFEKGKRKKGSKVFYPGLSPKLAF